MFEGRVQGVIEELLSDPNAKREDWELVFNPIKLWRAIFGSSRTRVDAGTTMPDITPMPEGDDLCARRPSIRRP